MSSRKATLTYSMPDWQLFLPADGKGPRLLLEWLQENRRDGNHYWREISVLKDEKNWEEETFIVVIRFAKGETIAALRDFINNNI